MTNEGWLIRTYASLDGLVPLPVSTEPEVVRSFPIRWRYVEDELPGWEDAWELVDLKAVLVNQDASDRFFQEAYNHAGTKVGGYPTEIQHGVGLDGFVFQIGTEEKARWGWVDGGVGYFFQRSGEWQFACQFY